MKLLFLLAVLFGFLSWVIPREAMPATGCAYPGSLDTFTNVSSGSILTAADYNKLLCAVEKLEDSLRIPNFTVATRPASPQLGRVIYVTDAVDATTCDSGGGSTRNVCVWNGTNWITTGAGGGGGGAPTGANYITRTSDGTLSAEFALGSLATGLLKNTTGTGTPTIAVQGTDYYAPGGTDVAIADGGTGASTQAGAQAALGVTPGTNVFIQRTFQDHTSVFTWTNGDGIAGNPTPRIANSLLDGSSHFAADSGSTDAYAACPLSISTMSTPALIDGSFAIIRVNTANTDGATLNLCGLGAQDLLKLVGGVATPLVTGDLDPNYPILVTYRSSTADWLILSTLKSAGTGTGGPGTPGGSTTQVQVNSAGAFAGDPDFTFDPATNRVSAGGGFQGGDCTTNCTTQANTATGLRTANWAISADYDIAGTAGTKTSGDATKFDASGRIVRGGTANKVFQFMLGAENGSVLVDGDDQPSIFYNHYGQGITINSVWCQSDAGSPTINLQNDDGSPANILSSSLTCSTGNGTSATGFSGTENQIAQGNRVNLLVVAAGGVAKRIIISARYTLD